MIVSGLTGVHGVNALLHAGSSVQVQWKDADMFTEKRSMEENHVMEKRRNFELVHIMTALTDVGRIIKIAFA